MAIVQKKKNNSPTVLSDNSNSSVNSANSGSVAAKRLKEEKKRDIYRLPQNFLSPTTAPSFSPNEVAYQKKQKLKQEQKAQQRRVVWASVLCFGFTVVAVIYIMPRVAYSRILQQTEAADRELLETRRAAVPLTQREQHLQDWVRRTAPQALQMEKTPMTPERHRIFSLKTP
jgi:hypothetical protein